MKFCALFAAFYVSTVFVSADDCCGCHNDAFIVKEKKKGDDTVIMQDSTGGKMIHQSDKKKNNIVWTDGGGECCPKIKHHIVKVCKRRSVLKLFRFLNCSTLMSIIKTLNSVAVVVKLGQLLRLSQRVKKL